jgi:hypothetical protein
MPDGRGVAVPGIPLAPFAPVPKQRLHDAYHISVCVWEGGGVRSQTSVVPAMSWSLLLSDTQPVVRFKPHTCCNHSVLLPIV